MTANEGEVAFDALTPGERIYGARPSNFRAAYQLMQSAGIPLPRVYATGVTANGAFHFQVMELLPGVSVREFLAWNVHPKMDALHAVVGCTLGKLHQITRPYDGWASQTQPYDTSWTEAFFAALAQVLDQACSLNKVILENRSTIREAIAQSQKKWIAPSEYVFSHVDGFQGMAHFDGNVWALTGVVDIEDHSFTDQRFVLAGHELALHFELHQTPESFWRGYGQFAAAPDSYLSTRNIFQLFYLLDWLQICYDGRGHAVQKRDALIHHFQTLILERCT
ncbi:MAG: phosphotransferase [Caldilineaceae bacterium]